MLVCIIKSWQTPTNHHVRSTLIFLVHVSCRLSGVKTALRCINVQTLLQYMTILCST